MALTLRFWTMSISDFLDEYFETDVIKANFAISGIIGTALGPMSPGTAYVLLHHYMGEVDGSVGAWGYARGGMGAVTQALAASFRAAGGTIRTGAERRAGPGQARHAPQASCWQAAKRSAASLVISNADVKRTFLKLVEERAARTVPAAGAATSRSAARRARSTSRSIPCRNSRRCLQGFAGLSAATCTSPTSIERMERAYDDWKAGRWSADPFLDMVIPTTLDPTMAPPGKHFMSCFVQYCPPKVEGRDWTDADRDGFAESVICADSRLFAGLPRPHRAHGGAHAARARSRGRA